jgi:hypothetical protein
MKAFKVLNRRSATEIEQVLARTAIASLVAFASGDMGKGVLDRSALSQLGAPRWASLKRTKSSLAGLVSGDRNRSPSAGGGLSALGT